MTTKRTSKPPTTLRLRDDQLSRADALIPVFSASKWLAPTGKADRSDVLRRAIDFGLDALEYAAARGWADSNVGVRGAAKAIIEDDRAAWEDTRKRGES